MPHFLVERNVPEAGRLTPVELHAISLQLACDAREQGGEVIWVTSYVTRDQFYCLYTGPNEEQVWEHTRRCGFPATRVTRVISVLMPPPSVARGRARPGQSREVSEM